MSEQSFILQGGLDQESAVAAIPPGRALSVSNYEAMSRGYQRTQGYERFDGQPRPSDAVPYIIVFDEGAVAIDEGDVLTGAISGATAVVLADAVLNTGTPLWNGAAAGRVPVYAPTDDFEAGENLLVGATVHAAFVTIAAQAAESQTDEAAAWLLAAKEYARSQIEEVPGTGPVRGVLFFEDTVYAWRDGTVPALNFDGGSEQIRAGEIITGATSGATATVTRVVLESGDWQTFHNAAGYFMLKDVVGDFEDNEHIDSDNGGDASANGVLIDVPAGKTFRATDDGWAEVVLGMNLSFGAGSIEIVAGDTLTGADSNAHGTVRAVTLTPDAGRWDEGTAEGVISFDDDLVGLFVEGEELQVGGVTRASSIGAQEPSYFPAGGRYEFEVHNFYGSTGTERAYGANGVGPAFDFDGSSVILIPSGMPVDTPFLVQAHKKHLFLGFPGGSLQHSAPGNPLSFDAVFGAAEIGLGHELTGLVANVGGTLTIATTKSISALYGNDVTDWQLETLSVDDTGALPHTMQRIGQTIYLDERGVRSIAATSAFGGFKMGSYTSLIQKSLCDKRAAGVSPVGSMVVKTKDQYLLFFDDTSGVSIYFGRKQPEAMLFDYPFTVFCTYVAEISGTERTFVGAEDGFVYELNRGTSFDGEVIPAFVQLTFGHQGGPRTLKRYHKAIFDLIANPRTELSVQAMFDLGDGSIQPYILSDVFGIDGGGGLWAQSDAAILTSPTLATAEAFLTGMGCNMSLVVMSSSAEQESDILQTATVVFTPRSQKR